MRLIKPITTDHETYKGLFILIPESGIDFELLKGMSENKYKYEFISPLGIITGSHGEINIETSPEK